MTAYGEILRRLYREVVVGRSRVRIIQATEPSGESPPIFVIGIYRSGTTLVRYVLDSHSRIACPPESEFLVVLERLLADDGARVGLDTMGFDEPHVLARARAFANYFFESYAASMGKMRWADKSPRYVDHLSFLARLYPNARFLVIHRFPLDQIASFTRNGTFAPPALGGPTDQDTEVRRSAARYWRDKTRQILEFQRAHEASVLAFRYEELCQAPEATLRRVFDFVGEPWEAEILSYHRFEHDLGREAGRPSGTRGIQRSTGRFRTWDEDTLRDCVAIVEDMMTAVGYDPSDDLSAPIPD